MKSDKIKNILCQLDYRQAQFSDNYCVQIDGSSAIKFDSIAFGSEHIQDVSTSCIAVQEIKDENQKKFYIKNTKYAATPVLILLMDNRVQIWNIMPKKEQLVVEDDFEKIQFYLEKNRFDFQAENLLDAKHSMRQITIFEAVGLIDFTHKVTSQILGEEFERALLVGKNYLSERNIEDSNVLNNLTSITMHVISALIIYEKTVQSDIIPDIFDLIKRLSGKYKDYFSEKIMLEYGKELIEVLYDALDRDINYKSVDHELLGYFYETTLLQPDGKKARKIRKEYGIYYTPKYLAEEIVNAIPFENLPEKKRLVFDGSCGSGSLLLSAGKRLEELLRAEKNGFKRHEYLTHAILGYDVDRFAAEVARLSLLLYSLPYGNKWKIYSRDLLNLNFLECEPTIILGNPPYGEVREGGTREQKAAEFVERYIRWLAPDGYMGVILPESFLQNDSTIHARRELLQNMDIMEIWNLPGTIFQNNCAVVVLIAKKCERNHRRNVTRIRTVVKNRKSIVRFQRERKWDFEYFVEQQEQWIQDEKCIIKYSPIDSVLDKMTQGKHTLCDICIGLRGIMMPSDFEKYLVGVEKREDLYLQNAYDFSKYYMSEKMVRHMKLINYDALVEQEEKIRVNYEGLRLKKTHEDVFKNARKVLVKMSSTPGTAEPIAAVLDESRCYSGQSFYNLVSKDEEKYPPEVICALLNSDIVNAFVRRACNKRTLIANRIWEIPVPEFTEKQKEQIVKLVNSLRNEMSRKAIKEINKLVSYAFKMNCEEQQALYYYRQTFQGNSEEVCDNEEKEEYQNISGIVEEVDFKQKKCMIHVAEYDQHIDICIAPNMPGWFLESGVRFSADMSSTNKLRNIKLLRYASLTREEIFEKIEQRFKMIDKTGEEYADC